MKKMSIVLRIFLISLLWTSLNGSTSVSELTLSNGIKVFVKEDHRSSAVIFQVWYKVGSRLEPEGLTGISHALEHMMFKGTPKFPHQIFTQKIVEKGGHNNASTNDDYTNYYELLGHRDLLPTVMELEADRMQHLSLLKKDFIKEIEVVKEERLMRTDNDPKGRAYERFRALAFTSSPYRHPTVGWPFDLNHLQVTDLKAWYQRYYNPAHAIIVMVGDIDTQKAFSLAKKYFELIPQKVLESSKPQEDMPPLGERRIVVNIPAEVSWIILGFPVPSLKTAQESWEPYALLLFSEILNGSYSARFEKNLVRGQGIGIDMDVSYNIFSTLDDLFTISGTPQKKYSTDDLECAFLKEIADIQIHGISSKELQRVKIQIQANEVYAQDSLMNQAQRIGLLAINDLDIHLYEDIIKKISAITSDQIQKVAQKYFVKNQMSVGVLVPEKSLLKRGDETGE